MNSNIGTIPEHLDVSRISPAISPPLGTWISCSICPTQSTPITFDTCWELDVSSVLVGLVVVGHRHTNLVAVFNWCTGARNGKYFETAVGFRGWWAQLKIYVSPVPSTFIGCNCDGWTSSVVGDNNIFSPFATLNQVLGVLSTRISPTSSTGRHRRVLVITLDAPWVPVGLLFCPFGLIDHVHRGTGWRS